MKMMMFLTWLLGMVSFGTFVWLTVVAFKQRMLWGFLVLFLSPITAVIFAIKYWQESKKPFLWHTGSSLGCLVLFLMLFGQMGGFQMLSMAHRLSQGEEITEDEAMAFIENTMDRMESSGMLSDEDQQELQQMRAMMNEMKQDAAPAGVEGSNVADVSIPSAADPLGEITKDPAEMLAISAKSGGLLDEPLIPPQFRGYTPVPFGTAREHVGEVVRAVAKDGREYRGVLAQANRNSLLLERDMTAGTVSFEVTASEIESLHVLVR